MTANAPIAIPAIAPPERPEEEEEEEEGVFEFVGVTIGAGVIVEKGTDVKDDDEDEDDETPGLGVTETPEAPIVVAACDPTV